MSDSGETGGENRPILAPMMLDEDALHAACEAKDSRFDGRFYVGVTSTGVYCRCVCPARIPKRANRRFFPSAAAAEKGGFRPCLVCRPEKAPGAAPIDQKARLAAQALSRIEAGALEEQGLDDLARDLGVTGRHLRRATADMFGASPIDLAQTHRLLTAKRLLTETRLPVTEVAFASGFQSVRRFNALFLERYGFAPSRLRARRTEAKEPTLTLDLVARGSFDAKAHLAFLESRALSGVEVATPASYTRTLRIGAHTGWISIRDSGRGVTLTLSHELAPTLRPLVSNVRGAFDLDADMTPIDAALKEAGLETSGDPGVRIPGGLDPFEMAVRAVLGQQVTVSAGRTLAQRLVTQFGRAVATDVAGLTRLFPSAAELAGVDPGEIAALGMPRARAETVVRLAAAAAEGRLQLARGAIAAGREGLAQIAGIGPWTIEYVALRGLGDPDAFPSGDSAIRSALGMKEGVEAHAARWSPWRAYAAVRLWKKHALSVARRDSYPPERAPGAQFGDRP
jgi:AraC family transcriptional regulator, regulatory protein of adaptative response / DNA-3-methyladenine glycosylase II